jgi:RNA polymerase sigma-70 factor (ECF subfamily)
MSRFPCDGVIISDCTINSRGVGMSLEPNEVDNGSRDTGQTMLYERYGQALFGYLRLHAHSLEDAEDLLLEVFLAALERDNLSALPPGGQPAWLRRVAHNKLLNLYRQTSRHPHVVLDSVVDTLLETDGPEQQALRQEEHSQVRAALQKLPPLQQHILQLRYGDGLRCAEIALLLDKREEAVRKLLSRSILALRQVYQLNRQTEGESSC